MIAFTALATIRMHAADPSPSTAVSLISNGGFEEQQKETGDPRSWFGTRVKSTAGHYLLSTAPSLAHDGHCSVTVVIADNHPNLEMAYNWMTDVQGWRSNETYELTGWIKSENAERTPVIVAQFLSEDGKRMLGGASTEKTCPIKGTMEWTKVSTRFVIPDGTGILRVRAGLPSKGNLGAKVWFDDLSLVKVSK